MLPLDVVYGLECADDMVDAMNSLIRDCIDRHVPLRRTKVTRPPAPWLQTDEIRLLQSERDHLRKQAHENGSEASWNTFREVRNKIKSVVNKARRLFLSKALSSKRPKEVWKVIHRILNPSPKPLRENPDELNRYFVSTATRIMGSEPDDSTDLLDFLHSLPEHPTGFTFRKVTFEEVLKEINRLRSDSSTGYDQIPVKYIKLGKDHLAGPLMHIINTCIAALMFPRVWKTARVSPIPKIDQPIDKSDFRPVSILPALSKIYERLVLSQLVSHIDEQFLLGGRISGYRQGHSTCTVLIGIRDDLIWAMNRGEVTMMVCADYSKAFDTVQFKALLRKMHCMGFSKTFLLWVHNYLTQRRQFVQIDDRSSEMAPVHFGVPQGSILGPVLFNLYVADLQGMLDCPCYQYADDTTFYLHSKVSALAQCSVELNGVLSRLGDYSESSNLALNCSKTKWMLISTPQMAHVHNLDVCSVPVACREISLERITCTKLLGVQLDHNLKWNDHVKSLLTSCYGTLSILRKLRNLAPFYVRKNLAESLVIGKLDYASTVFYPLSQYQVDRLQRLQNACAGFVLRKYARPEDLAYLNWLPISERRDFNILKLTHKAIHSSDFPEYLSLELRNVHTHNLRLSEAPLLLVPKETGTFQHSAASIFNKLPSALRNIKDYNSFCRSLRKYLSNRVK